MTRLDYIELNNFKSYSGFHKFGPLTDFTCIVGPNGSGKSNLLDAIGFVLGVSHNTLRSNRASDFVHRNCLDSFTNREIECFVALEFKDDDDQPFEFKRNIVPSKNNDNETTSEYYFNNRKISWTQYSKTLEKYNIITPAKSCIVFQGDIEAIALQTPADLTRWIEKISGSDKFKSEYDNFKRQLNHALEETAFLLTQKRGMNAELRNWQEQKEEAEQFLSKISKKKELDVHLQLYKALHIERQWSDTTAYLNTILQETRPQIMLELSATKDKEKQSQKFVATIKKSIMKLQDNWDKVFKTLDTLKPQTVAVEEKIKVTGTLKSRRDAQLRIFKDNEKYLKQELELYEDQIKQIGQVRDQELSELEIVKEESILSKPKTQKQANDLKNKYQEASASLLLKKEELMRACHEPRQRIKHEEEKQTRTEQQLKLAVKSLHEARHNAELNSANFAKAEKDYQFKKESFTKHVNERNRLQRSENEISEKLTHVLNEISKAENKLQDSKFRRSQLQMISELKKRNSRVLGTVSEIAKPLQKNYELACSVILSSHMFSILTENIEVAKDCLQYLQENRKGTATFIPLTGLNTQTSSSNASAANGIGVRRALDVIQFDPKFENAMRIICGDTLICDDMNTARTVARETGNKFKIVTLDGTILHKSGLITGGSTEDIASSSLNSDWDATQIESLHNLKSNLLDKLKTVIAQRRQLQDTKAQEELTHSESEYLISKEAKDTSDRQLKACESQVKVLQSKVDEQANYIEDLKSSLKPLEEQLAEVEANLKDTKTRIFSSFCKQYGIDNIQEVEKQHDLRILKAQNSLYRIDQQIDLLKQKVSGVTRQLDEVKHRISNLEEKQKAELELSENLTKELRTVQDQKNRLEAELEILHSDQMQEETRLKQAKEEQKQIETEHQKLNEQLVQLNKQIDSKKFALQRFIIQRKALLRHCKLEEINIPLISGSLNDVSLDESGQDEMDQSFDNTDSDFFRTTGILLDYSSIDHDNEDLELKIDSLETEIKSLASQIAAISPNMKADEHLAQVEDRAQSTEEEWYKARRKVNNISEKFEKVKAKRYQAFSEAFTHISEQIDVIYKELTKSNFYPLGGLAYLSLEDTAEPYLKGIQYHAMPPNKRFRETEQLSGGERTVASLALLFAAHSYKPSPFFVLDEIDAALDQQNLLQVSTFIRNHFGTGFQFIVISLNSSFYKYSESLIGIYKQPIELCSKSLSLDLRNFPLGDLV